MIRIRQCSASMAALPARPERLPGLFSHARRRLWPIWRTILWFSLSCALLGAPVAAFAAVIQAMPDRDPVRVGESFSLTFVSEENPDGDPDFSPLEQDFEILGQSQNSQVSIVDGKMTRKQEWVLTLMPKRAGTIPIPSVAFGADRSQAAALVALDAAIPTPAQNAENTAEILLEAEAEPKEPYFQAQTLYTVRVLHRVNLLGGDLPDPVVEDARVERLGEDRRFTVMRGGFRYAALERKYALFPQKSGLLRLPPMKLEAQVEAGVRTFFSRDVRVVRVQSPALDLKVRPVPVSFPVSHWLPAARLKLEETWSKDPPGAKAGEPLTRTLTLRAEGATAGMLPALGANAKLDPSVKSYPDQPAQNEEKQANGIASVRQEKIALIPGQAGEFKLPAVEIPWWNTQTDRLEIARLPERILTVEASGEAANVAPSAPVQGASDAAAPTLGASPPVDRPLSENPWFWASLFLAFGWLATALAWLWRSRHRAAARPAGKADATRDLPDERAARRILQQACERDDAVAARAALLAWTRARWPEAAPATLADSARLGGDALAEAIAGLNRALYGADPGAWRGAALWRAVSACLSERKTTKTAELTPLYPY